MRHFIILIFLLCKIPSFAQSIYSSKKEIVVINIDSNTENFFRTKSDNGKEIYVLNYRLKLAKDYHSRIGDNADMMFTFYIAPDSKLELRKIKTDDEVFKNKIVNPIDAKNKFEDENYINNFNFAPILKIKTNYYSFSNATILGQGFLIEEYPQYFPTFGAKSAKFKLNLLSKPYSSITIDSLRKVISKDSTSLKPYGAWVDDFYDKWFIKSINSKDKEINFWINLKQVHDLDFTFGRVTSEIKYKIGVGITEFSIIPFESEFSKRYLVDLKKPVKFYFKEFVDVKQLIN